MLESVVHPILWESHNGLYKLRCLALSLQKYAMKIFKEYLEASGNSALDVDNLPNSELDELLAKFYALVSVLLTNQMTRIFKIRYIKQILTAYSGHG